MTSASTSRWSRSVIEPRRRQVGGDAPQRAVDEDAHRALGSPEHARRSRPSTSRRRSAGRARAGDRPAGGAGPRRAAAAASRPSDGVGRVVAGVDDRRGGLERRLRPATQRPALVGDVVAGDLEQPDAERGGAFAVGRARAVLEARQGRERLEEDARRRVLRVVMIAELVEGEAVHLREVPAVQGVELGRIALGRLDERPIAVEMRDLAGAGPGRRHAAPLPLCRSLSSTPRAPFRYTPTPTEAAARRTWTTLAAMDDARRRCRRRRRSSRPIRRRRRARRR